MKINSPYLRSNSWDENSYLYVGGNVIEFSCNSEKASPFSITAFNWSLANKGFNWFFLTNISISVAVRSSPFSRKFRSPIQNT